MKGSSSIGPQGHVVRPGVTERADDRAVAVKLVGIVNGVTSSLFGDSLYHRPFRPRSSTVLRGHAF